jgi:hypothetical protein
MVIIFKYKKCFYNMEADFFIKKSADHFIVIIFKY